MEDGVWGLGRTWLRAKPEEPGEGLQGFAQAHVVGEDAAEIVFCEVGEKMKTLELIRAQLSAKAGGQRGRDACLQLGGAALDGLRLRLGQELLRRRVRELERVEALRLVGQFTRGESETGELLVLLGGELEREFAPALFRQPHEAALRREE